MTRNMLVSAWAVAAVLPSFAADPARGQTTDAAAKAASCNACHGPYGRSEAGIPALAGRSADQLYEMLLSFKRGERSAFVMHQHAKGYSDQELKDFAAHFAAQTPAGARK